MPSFEYGLARGWPVGGSGGGAPGLFRIVPVSANEAFVVAPHPTFGAVAYRWLNGNGGDNTTPALSIGAPFGGWRIAGWSKMADVQDPISSRSIIQEGTGAAQYAIQLGDGVSLFGGTYHGGLQNFVQNLPDLTVAAMLPAFVAKHTTTITWAGGRTATIDETVRITADGALETTTVSTCAIDVILAYFGMSIATSGSTMARADGGAWQSISTPADYLFPTASTIELRDPVTGVQLKNTNDAITQPFFQHQKIVTFSNGNGVKIYPTINPPAPQGYGTVTVNRRQELIQTPPDPPASYLWDGTVNGNAGYTNVGGVTFDNTSKEMVFTEPASGFNRATFAMVGLTPGQNYSVTITVPTITGSSPSGNTTVATSLASNGGSASAIGSLSQGTPSFTFNATNATMYLSLTQQSGAPIDSVARVSRITQPVAA